VEEAEARRRFAAARVATLATLDGTGAAQLVPVVFAVDGTVVWSATDGKPKRGTALRRYANVRRDPRVSLLVQHWDEAWDALWWVRAEGSAAVVTDESTVEHVVRLLRDKYSQYRTVEVGGPLLQVTVRAWRGWSAT
jgi:PPOX class probable F420-dependent enzyme